MIKAVIFDLDQTLLDRSATFQLFVKDQHQRFVSHLKGCDEVMYLETMLMFDNNGYKDKQTMFAEVCEHLSLSIDSDVLFEDFKVHYGTQPVLFDDVVEVLKSLKNKYKLAVITNGRVKAQATKIRVAGIDSYFDVVTISEAVGVKKPNPAIFHHCLDKLQLEAEDCIYIGDNPVNDVEAALKVGMKAVWIKNRHFKPPAMQCEGEIENVTDLLDILARLE